MSKLLLAILWYVGNVTTKYILQCVGYVLYQPSSSYANDSIVKQVYKELVKLHRLGFKAWVTQVSEQGAVSIRETVLPGMAIPMLKIRRPNGRLIFNMEIAIRR